MTTVLDLPTPRFVGHPESRPQPDYRDVGILLRRLALLNEKDGPREGDFVDFADGTVRRISFMCQGWPFAQTSDQGSYYLGDGYISMSGSLHPGVRLTTLTLTSELRLGQVWFFHHDWHRGHNAVHAEIPLRVFTCTEEAPR